MKKNYLAPNISVVQLHMQQMITASKFNTVNSDEFIFGGGGSTPGSRVTLDDELAEDNDEVFDW